MRHRLVGVLAGLLLIMTLAGSQGATLSTAQTVGPCEVVDGDRPLGFNETRLLEKINRDRGEAGLPPIELSPTLLQAARWKAAALAQGGSRTLQAADQDDGDRTWDQRLLDCGYPATAFVGQNLGMVFNPAAPPDPLVSDADDAVVAPEEALEDLVEEWQSVPIEAGNFVSSTWSYAGLARVRVDTVSFWVLILGSDPS